jgi:hypothetical protein
MVLELIVMYAIQHRAYRAGIDNLLVLLIGGIQIICTLYFSLFNGWVSIGLSVSELTGESDM